MGFWIGNFTINGTGENGHLRYFVDEANSRRNKIPLQFRVEVFPENYSSQELKVFLSTNLNNRDKVKNRDQYFYLVPFKFTGATTDNGHLVYSCELQLELCGVYRNTVYVELPNRQRLYQNNFTQASGLPGRDIIILGIPPVAKSLRIYELNIRSVNSAFSKTAPHGVRSSTFKDLVPSKTGTAIPNQITLDRIAANGFNTIWSMPIHRQGTSFRKGQWGSPYSIADFFDVEETLGGWQEFIEFNNQRKKLGLKLMFDNSFNHCSPDLVYHREIDHRATTKKPAGLLKDLKPHWFTKKGLDNFYQRATSPEDIATAPAEIMANSSIPEAFTSIDGHRLQKQKQLMTWFNWYDTLDFYIGDYSRLHMPNFEFNSDYCYHDLDQVYDLNYELLDYLCDYMQYWISIAGLDAIRCDYAQGLPNQAWEYIINYTRSLKWDFIFMSESYNVRFPMAKLFDILFDGWLQILDDADGLEFCQTMQDRKIVLGSNITYLSCLENHDNPRYPKTGNSKESWLARHAVLALMKDPIAVMMGQEFGEAVDYNNWDAYVLKKELASDDAALEQQYALLNRFRAENPWLSDDYNDFILNNDRGTLASDVVAFARWSCTNKNCIVLFSNITPRQTAGIYFLCQMEHAKPFEPDKIYCCIDVKTGRQLFKESGQKIYQRILSFRFEPGEWLLYSFTTE